MPASVSDAVVPVVATPRRRRRARVVLVIVVLGGALAVGSLYLQTAAEPPYQTAAVQQRTLTHDVYATATLNARVTVNVGSQLSGVVKDVMADHNQRVTRGQLLALFDTDRLQAELDQADAAFESARALLERARVQLGDAEVSLRRTQQLSAAGLVSDADRESTEARFRSVKAEATAQERQVAQATAAVELARANLKHAAVRSPIDGVVLSRRIEVGESVNLAPQSPTLFVIGTHLRDLELDIDVAEADIGLIVAGQPVHFTVDAYPRQVFSGRVREVRVGPSLKQQAVYYRVIAAVANTDLQLRPGMTADAWIETARHEHALLIPPTAIRQEDGRTYVEVPAGTGVSRRTITTGLRNPDGLVEVLSGLARGEQIVISRKQS